GEIGQLVDGEDAAVGARQQAVVHGQLVGEVEPGRGCLDRIDVADHVGDGDVGRGELLDVPILAAQPADAQGVALGGDAGAARGAQRRQRVVVDLAAGHDRNLLVQQIDQAAQDAALRLAAQAEQDEVVPREHRVDQLRDDRLVVADDAGKQALARAQLAHQVVANLLLDRPLVFAHRGGSALAPENTIAAFDNGLALGADGLELDVHLSRDGVVVVHHDPTLERTTNARGAIRLKTAAELAGIDAGYQFRARNSHSLPAEAGSHEQEDGHRLPAEAGSHEQEDGHRL